MKKFTKGFVGYHLDKHNFAITTHVALLATALVVFFYFISVRVEEGIKEQILHREQVIVRAGAESIGGYLDLVGNNISLLANEYIFSTPVETLIQERLDSYMDKFRDTSVVGITWFDKNGVVKYASGVLEKGDVGASVADREYFTWAKEASGGDIFLSTPLISRLGATKGEAIIVIASPTFVNEKFEGVLVSTISLKKLTDKFLSPLKMSDRDRIYLIDLRGNIIYSPKEDLYGANYFDVLEGKIFKGKEKTVELLKLALKSRSEGKLNVILPNEDTGKLTNFLIAHAPLPIGNNPLMLSIAVPSLETEVITYFVQIYEGGYLVIALLLLISTLFLIYAIRDMQLGAYSEGLAHGRKQKSSKED